MTKNLDEIVEMIMNKEITIRGASEQFGYSRDVIRKSLEKKYGKSDELRKILDENRAKSTTLELDQDLLKKVFEKAMNKEITLKEAQDMLGIKDKETLRMKFLEYAQDSENKEIRELYQNYIKEHEADYSKINFRKEAILMIRGEMCQTDVAKKLGIPRRTVSREFEKFKNDKNKSFYMFLKMYNEAFMKGRKFSEYELLMQNIFLDEYENDNHDLIYGKNDSKSERIQLEEYYVEQEKILKGQGLTQQKIAEKLHTSVSALRRARKNVEKRLLLEEKVNEFDEAKYEER